MGRRRGLIIWVCEFGGDGVFVSDFCAFHMCVLSLLSDGDERGGGGRGEREPR